VYITDRPVYWPMKKLFLYDTLRYIRGEARVTVPNCGEFRVQRVKNDMDSAFLYCFKLHMQTGTLSQ